MLDRGVAHRAGPEPRSGAHRTGRCLLHISRCSRAICHRALAKRRSASRRSACARNIWLARRVRERQLLLLAPTYLLIGATLLLALATLFVCAGMRRVDGFVASDREPLPLALWFDYVRRQMAATSILVLKVAPEAPGHTARHLAIELAHFTDAATTRVGQSVHLRVREEDAKPARRVGTANARGRPR